MPEKPLGKKNYGSIPHLPDSRMGIGDHKCSEGQARIATVQTRDKHDEVIVTEKLDGSNVGVAKLDNFLYPLSRAGYMACHSPYEQHQHFYKWVFENYWRFHNLLREGERLVGEWLMQAHGTRYELKHEPFVAFDLMKDDNRLTYDELITRINNQFVTPTLIHRGPAISIKEVMARLGKYGFHGAIDEVEGAVWKVERDVPNKKKVVDFLVKYVRPEKQDGIYLPEVSKKWPVWNWYPNNEE